MYVFFLCFCCIFCCLCLIFFDRECDGSVFCVGVGVRGVEVVSCLGFCG